MLDRITKNLLRSECVCFCGCEKASIDYQLALVHQSACDMVSKKLGYKCISDITNVFRCEQHNYDIGGVDGSYHTEGAAMDFKIREITIDQLIGYVGVAIRELGFEGMFDIVEHENYIHLEIDLRRILNG